jgi:hypothetical protein
VAGLVLGCFGEAPPAQPVPEGVVEIPSARPNEISGVAAVPGGYAVVGDSTGDHGRIWPGGGRFAIEPKLAGPEAIDVVFLPAGGEVWLILDEDDRRLIDLEGGELELPKRLEEVCGRGLEGLAARWQDGRVEVAALWEGGFYDPGSRSPKDCRKRKGELRRPIVARFAWKPGAGAASPPQLFELAVPDPGDDERFRASALVWDGDGLLVLLRSTNAADDRYSHTWLQRFDLDGVPVGVPLKLDEVWGAYCAGKNWEALDWTLDGAKLVMGHDQPGSSELVLFAPP